jgi:hypothetical protein
MGTLPGRNMGTLRDYLEYSTGNQTDALMEFLNDHLNPVSKKSTEDMDSMPPRKVMAVGVALREAGKELILKVLRSCKHEKLHPEKYPDEHKRHQQCLVCGATRWFTETNDDMGYTISSKWSDWNMV